MTIGTPYCTESAVKWGDIVSADYSLSPLSPCHCCFLFLFPRHTRIVIWWLLSCSIEPLVRRNSGTITRWKAVSRLWCCNCCSLFPLSVCASRGTFWWCLVLSSRCEGWWWCFVSQAPHSLPLLLHLFTVYFSLSLSLSPLFHLPVSLLFTDIQMYKASTKHAFTS